MLDKHPRDLLNSAVGALLGAACGDALGWSNERPNHSYMEKSNSSGLLFQFQKWTRRSGGRYYPHEQTIDAGSYSDDTQLILYMSRSLLYGPQWWDWFCYIELPFWSLYERGGGGATKRAASAWANGIPPWSEKRKEEDVKKYFDAGGNGVAMRILPHILFKADSDTYAPVAQNILLDGIATHGHPRALVGALCYGYALWRSIQRTDTLRFGEIIDDLLENSKNWGVSPESCMVSAEWLHAAKRQVLNYQNLWMEAVNELTSYLNTCRQEISKGALALDDHVLRSIHCYNRKVSGAGTVAAAAAVYLASRYAPEPVNGITKAAYAVGIDTDTIASMVGGLSGVISGIEWLPPVNADVQDSEYLYEMGKVLTTKKTDTESVEIHRHGIRSQLKKFQNHLLNVNLGESIDLPDRRCGKVVSVEEMIGKSGEFKVFVCKIETDDGQSLEISKIVRGSFKDKQLPVSTNGIPTSSNTLNFGIKLPSQKLDQAVWFYNEVLGLEVKKKTSDTVVFEEGLVLVPDKYYPNSKYGGSDLRTLIYIEVSDIERLFSRVKGLGIKIFTSLSLWGDSNRSYFRCSDLDGNIIEVFSTAIG